MRRRLVLLTLFVLILAPLLRCSSGSDGGVGGGPGSFEVGPPGSAEFSSIQEAVTAAPAGSRILVRPGTYSEQVSIVKSMTIVGSGPGTVIDYPTGGPADSAVIEIRDVAGVTIEALSVQASELNVDGIRVRDAMNVVLESVTASGNSEDGVDVRQSTAVSILRGSFENNGADGIQVDEGADNVAIVGCTSASNGGDGIKVRLSANVLVQGNTSTLNGDDGLLVRDSTGVQVTGNTFTSNAGWGITVNDSPHTIVDDNVVESNLTGDIKCDPGPCLSLP